MNRTRPYRKSVREAAQEATRERIVEAAREAFVANWYDDVTVRGVAADAGVAVQTVMNHFATKEDLYAAATQRQRERIEEDRWRATPGDIDEVMSVLMDDYEALGDFFIRSLAVEERLPVVKAPIAEGRAGHERWVEEMFPDALRGLRGKRRRRRLLQLVVATDVYTWKLLRRDKGLTRQETEEAMREMVLALHG